MPRVNQLHRLRHPHNHEPIPSNRLLGTTTAQALAYIAEAIKHPNRKIVVKDHANGPHIDKLLMDKIAGFIQKLDLKFMKLERRNGICSITFELYVDEPADTDNKHAQAA